jgi:hypothetical protein
MPIGLPDGQTLAAVKAPGGNVVRLGRAMPRHERLAGRCPRDGVWRYFQRSFVRARRLAFAIALRCTGAKLFPRSLSGLRLMLMTCLPIEQFSRATGQKLRTEIHSDDLYVLVDRRQCSSPTDS